MLVTKNDEKKKCHNKLCLSKGHKLMISWKESIKLCEFSLIYEKGLSRYSFSELNLNKLIKTSFRQFYER